MDGVLSQEEINALLDSGGDGGAADDGPGSLSSTEMDTIGEVANISMGTAATTLFSLVNRKVDISTPVVSEATWKDIAGNYEKPCVFIRIGYTLGLDGSNILVLKERDVKVITDLMMGNDGTNTDGELSELHLSAISEAMNQMMGSAATSLSSMLNKMIDISPPVADLIDLQETVDESEIEPFLAGHFVKIAFKMQIGDLVDSEIMQLYPYSFAHEMCDSITKNMQMDSESVGGESAPAPAAAQSPAPAPAPAAAPPPQAAAPPPMAAAPPPQGMPMAQPVDMSMYGAPVNIQPAQFQPFVTELNPALQKENIDLIMDVPLEVTVELGRTSKSIQDILDFAPGTIIELNKLAGEPVDILVNGKYVAKGEVVVIEESFGVRLTEIIK
ncbi:MAG: flagellar motor switch phosphatase FliY [Lachnospiraceae bacterium]|nr:flagellar motor switch phosphatase FliY [Lachnospiraceae bacterium]